MSHEKASRMIPPRPGASATPLDRARQLCAHMDAELKRHRLECRGETCPRVIHRQAKDAEALLRRLELAAIRGGAIA